ncbi:hypothetical protein Pla52o_39550 [Novipirellula galeiformis]|uniref:Uncharacterized protein n=2 Tax=Novipirellula galeiformis TaxID=2528004 RepID=A0A5C6CBW3_9BACT|nr:hypothetical protein Pla52o_39550 [Novipirellula galeiformis]
MGMYLVGPLERTSASSSSASARMTRDLVADDNGRLHSLYWKTRPMLEHTFLSADGGCILEPSGPLETAHRVYPDVKHFSKSENEVTLSWLKSNVGVPQ